MIVFFLPVLFAVIIGPALIQVSHMMANRLRPATRLRRAR
jgi:hypothetical protein